MTSLDRFAWIPNGIGSETPRCVLDEWAETLGVQTAPFTSSQLVALLNERNRLLASTLIPVSGPVSPEQWTRLAQFINPRCKWTRTALGHAWAHWGHTLQTGAANAPSGEVGWPSPKSPRRIPTTLAYGQLRARNIYVPATATPSDLAELLHLSRHTGDGLKKAVHTLLEAHPQSTLSVWAFLSECASPLLKEHYVRGTDQQERLRTLFQRWESRMYTIERHEPQSHDEAVLLAAMHYGVDIHRSSNPLREYTHLLLSISTYAYASRPRVWGCVQYVHPVDPVLATWTSKNPDALSLRYAYVPVFPIELWPHEAAKDIAERWGKSATHESHVMTDTEFLQWRAVSNHFYAGVPYAPSNMQTHVDLTDVSTLPPNDAIAFGNEEQGYTLLTWQELQRWLDIRKHAVWPSAHVQTIDTCALVQLERLSTLRQWFPLVQTVRMLREEEQENKQSVRAFVTAWTRATLHEQQAVLTVLWTWLYLGMAMRGWNQVPPSSIQGISKTAYYLVNPFPLSETAVESGDTLDVRIHQWVTLLNDALDACTPSWRTIIARAHLHLYTEGKYIPAHDSEQGITLEDRLRVMTRTESVYACVRLSSNWMCSSAYYYLSQIGTDMPFAIRDLVRIA